jgi:hypothetical protein
MAVKYSNSFHFKGRPKFTQIGISVWKCTIWQPCFSYDRGSGPELLYGDPKNQFQNSFASVEKGGCSASTTVVEKRKYGFEKTYYEVFALN